MTINSLAVVRFGNEFWVVKNSADRVNVTREEAEAAGVVARFAFDGPAKKSNLEAKAANRRAVAFARSYMRGR